MTKKELDANSAIVGALSLLKIVAGSDLQETTTANRARLIAARQLMERGYLLFAEICEDLQLKADDAMTMVQAAEEEFRWLEKNTLVIEECYPPD